MGKSRKINSLNPSSGCPVWAILLLSTHGLFAQGIDEYAGNQQFNIQLDRAINWQKKADSLEGVAVEWRLRAQRIHDPIERAQLQGQIMEIEDSIRAYREKADTCFNALHPDRRPFIILDTILHGIRVYHYNLSDEFLRDLDRYGQQIRVPMPEVPGDTISKEKFENDFILPPGTFYRIQLAVYSRKISPDHFGELSPITTEKIEGSGLTRYFFGKFTRLDEALRALPKVRSAGFSDAFITGYFDGIKGTPEKIRLLENKK